ncbi:MAG: hypothetical protein Q9167_003629 [Letrouitia subvulpina]
MSPAEKKKVIEAVVDDHKKDAAWMQNFFYAHGKAAAIREADERRVKRFQEMKMVREEEERRQKILLEMKMAREEEERRQKKQMKAEEEQKAAAAAAATAAPEEAIRISKEEKPESIAEKLPQTPRNNNHPQQTSSSGHVAFALPSPGDSSTPPVPSGIKETRHFSHPIFQRRNSSPPDGPELRDLFATINGSLLQTKKTPAGVPKTSNKNTTGQKAPWGLILQHASSMSI